MKQTHTPFPRHCVTCVAGGGHAAADHSGNVPFGVEKRRQCLQLLGGWEASIDASSQACAPVMKFKKRKKPFRLLSL